MATHLSTPLVHRALRSPAGGLLETAAFERVKTNSLARTFGVARARAAADVSLGGGPAAFLAELPAPPAPHLHDRIERTLRDYANRRTEAEDAVERWEAAFWGDEATTDAERVAIERERRRTEARRARPTRLFRFLDREHLLPPVKYEIPDPETVDERWAKAVVDPSRLYGLDELPAVARSRSVAGPGTEESFLRFDSPSPYLDEATARVYEPAGWAAGRDGDAAPLPTLIFHDGLGSLNDRASYWPVEDAVARTLAPRGYRVILPDAPWHGRREVVGRYSGEPYLATAPVGTFTLLSAAAAETGVLVDWARREGAPVVGVGGLSLGGSVASHVAGRCGGWPERARPDLVVPVGAPGDVDRALFESRLSSLLGLDRELAEAGWTPDRLRDLAPLLDPPATPAVDPGSIVPFVGRRDDLAPVDTALELYDSWGVPDRNVTAWDAGHFGVLVRLVRDPAFVSTVAARLDAATVSRSEPASPPPTGEPVGAE